MKRPFGRIWNSCDIDVTMDFKQWNGEAGSVSTYEWVTGCCEGGNEPTGSKQCGEFCE